MNKKSKFNRELKIDKDYIPAETIEDDEIYGGGLLQWDITKMLEYINTHMDEVVLKEINVKNTFNSYIKVNEEHIKNVDITKPVIHIEISPEKYEIVDGRHRLIRAYREGIGSINSYFLTMEQHINFLTSIKAYDAYVEYWNGKIKNIEAIRKNAKV